MNSRVDLKLAPGVVDPLLDLLRVEAKQLSRLDRTKVSSLEICELESFLNLFDGAYQKTATITIVRSRAPTYVRACTYLRLHLRNHHLASIDDQVLETSLNPADYTGDLQRPVMSYCFLATIQECVLTHVGIGWLPGLEWGFPFRTIAVTVARLFREKERPTTMDAANPIRDFTEVVVINDPVNTMTYVVAVFQRVLGVSNESATKHMEEVHKQRSSVVWSGQKERADRYADELRVWHLRVETRSGHS